VNKENIDLIMYATDSLDYNMRYAILNEVAKGISLGESYMRKVSNHTSIFRQFGKGGQRDERRQPEVL